ncbi:CRISPR-associated Cse2 family protein [Haloactinospora alba]|uniref:CRISPR-associated Cse2 family protein n=1 Tax=Haloactinospora alba TaxID=405555 RepID=A0A543NH56_9ACTN|nr:type I-E CRISPR-associated protein Cse2/CasB [Haloactinospora alba]TQN31177.1 CRISPR-associated Cse2 family protein [Haloactinospora alba]
MRHEGVGEGERPELGVVGKGVHARVSKLQRGYCADNPTEVAELARLRNGAGKLPENTPWLWGETYAPEEHADSSWSLEREAQAEKAVHISLTLYALHQQSWSTKHMHQGPVWRAGRRRDRVLGWAMRELMPDGEIDEPLRRRFIHASTATTVTSLAHRLRALVQLLRREGVPLDYGKLADDLMTAQRPGGLRTVRRAWGRGFVSYRPAEQPDSSDDDPDKDNP